MAQMAEVYRKEAAALNARFRGRTDYEAVQAQRIAFELRALARYMEAYYTTK